MPISAPAGITRPSVNITFEGLLIFGFEKVPRSKRINRCIVGVVPCPDHKLEMSIDGQRPIGITAQKILFVSDGKQEVTKYGNGRVKHSSPKGDENDLGWLMAIEREQFHSGRKVSKDKDVIQQRFELTTGTFYTAVRTCDAVIRGPKATINPATIAAMVGCNIRLDAGQTLCLVQDDIVTHKFTHGSEIRKIQIRYSCDSPAQPDKGDFDFFYRIYNDVPLKERFDVISTRKLQLLRGLGLQGKIPTDLCPPIEGEPPFV